MLTVFRSIRVNRIRFLRQRLNDSLKICVVTGEPLHFTLTKSNSIVAFPFINFISFFTAYFHLVFGSTPSGRFLFIFVLKTFFYIFPFYLHTCSKHSNSLHLIYASLLGFLYRHYICFHIFLVSIIVYRFILLKVLFSHPKSFSLSLFVVGQTFESLNDNNRSEDLLAKRGSRIRQFIIYKP